jgi:hypothetical protein
VLFDEVEEAVEAGIELLGGGKVRIRRGQLSELALAAAQRCQDEVLLGREVVIKQPF